MTEILVTARLSFYRNSFLFMRGAIPMGLHSFESDGNYLVQW